MTQEAINKVEKLEEGFLRNLDRNFLRAGQYNEYKDRLQGSHSYAKQMQDQLNNQEAELKRFGNSPNAGVMSFEVDRTRDELINAQGDVQHLQNNGLKALKYSPEEIAVQQAKASGRKQGLVAGALGTAALGASTLGESFEMLSENFADRTGRALSNGAMTAGMMGLGAVIGHEGADAVEDTASDTITAADKFGIAHKLEQGQPLTHNEELRHNTRTGNILGLAKNATLDDPMHLANWDKMTKDVGNAAGTYAPVAGALMGAGFASRMNGRKPIQ